MKKGYNGYLIPNSERQKLLSIFRPKYSKIVAHHITHKFNVTKELPPEADSAKIIGYADSGDGLEALVVEINSKVKRPDGSLYHITLSLDPSKYKPKDSNRLLMSQGYNLITQSILIRVEPQFFPF